MMEMEKQWTNDTNKQNEALAELQNALGLPQAPNRMECYDISNTQGTNSVGSMVVFLQGVPDVEQLLDPTPDRFAEIGEHRAPQNDHRPRKARRRRVVHRVVEDGLAAGTEGLDLFQPAEAAAHPRRHHQKRDLFIRHFSTSFAALRSGVLSRDSIAHFAALVNRPSGGAARLHDLRRLPFLQKTARKESRGRANPTITRLTTNKK